MSFPYKSVSKNIDSINTGSFYEQSDLDNVLSSSINDDFFGISEQDVIEFSIYDIEENLQSHGVLPKKSIYNVINKTYKDVDNNIKTYNYKQYNSDYIISFTGSILLDTLSHLSSSGGNQVASYNFIRNVGGTKEYPLIIQDISVSRKEIKLIPSFKVDSSNEMQSIVNLELLSFAQKKLLVRDIVKKLIDTLSQYQIYSNSDILIKQNKETFSLMRKTFGFKTDLDVIKFLDEVYVGFTKAIQGNDNQIIYDVFDGILGYIKNWIYTYYKNIVSEEDLKKEFEYIVRKATEIRLKKINVFFGENILSQKLISEFIVKIFYSDFIANIISQEFSKYNNKFLGYLQNALNFNNNVYIPILNHSGYLENDGTAVIIVKLLDYLPKNVGLRDKCYISNISIAPLIQKVILNSPVVKKSFKIAGPNFKIKINDYQSKPVDYKTEADLQLSVEENKNISFYKKLSELNVDYNNFSNFILFSSAELRIKLYINKSIKIGQLNSQIDTYTTSSLNASSALSSSYAMDISTIQNQINTIHSGFDGFEVYLNSLPSSSLAGENLTSYLQDAVEYDAENKDSLINNTPNYITVDSENSDYLVFLAMIGHHFDNLYLYFNKFPTLQYIDNTTFSENGENIFSSGSNNYLSPFANILLEHFGWNPVSSFDDASITSTFLSGSNSVSNNEKLTIIWNRILKNLPILYKTKGTQECVKLLSNIYGIPSNLLNIKEFGGNNISTENSSSYTFDSRYYFTKFQGAGETLIIPGPLPLKTVEFKFKIDTDHIYPQNSPIYLMTNFGSDWNIRIIKDVQNYAGKIIATFNEVDLIIDTLPIFDGRIYNVMLRISEAEEGTFDSGDENPYILQFRVNAVDEDRIAFDSIKEEVLASEFAHQFLSSSNVYAGNFTPNNRFFGNIDKINMWSISLDDNAFVDHALNFDAYNNYNPSSSYQDLYFRYSVDYPVDLYTTGTFATLSNANKFYSNLTASIYHFSQSTTETINCVDVSSSAYPYQYDVIDIKQNIKSDNFGPNKYKNTKINKVTENVVARLLPGEKSTVSNTTPQDSNLIGVYISPFKIRDDDIINFLGNYDIMNEIASPDELYNSNYLNLQKLRDAYNTQNLSEKILYQEFLTLYKGYFDKSFFSTVKQLFPIRAKIIDGVIIEPSILERNKYQHRRIDSALSKNLDVSCVCINGITASAIPMQSSSIALQIPKNGNETVDYITNFKTNYISDEDDAYRKSIFSINGNFTDTNSSGSITSYRSYKSNKTYHVYKNNTAYSKSFCEYNFNESGSLFSGGPYIIDIESYPKGHKSTYNRPLQTFSTTQFGENSITSSVFIKSQQTIYTTVNDMGIPDGTSPVEITSVQRDINQISLTSS